MENMDRLAQKQKGSKEGESKPGPGPNALVWPELNKEPKIVIVSDWNERHNGVAFELAIRETFKTRLDWRIVAIRGAGAFSPAILKDAVLLIANRGPDADPLALSGGEIIDKPKMGSLFWTGENANSVLANVRDRGMGFIALHATMQCGNPNIMAMLDFVPAMEAEGEPQPVWVRNTNRDHPVTRDVGKFHFVTDEQPVGVLRSPDSIVLFETTGIHSKRESVGGWCRTIGRGRVAAFLPGHSSEAYAAPEFRAIIWNAAHWAMNRDAAPYPGLKNTLY
jgi:hypothetical protein